MSIIYQTIQKHAQRQADKIAIIAEDTSLSYAQLFQHVERLSDFLRLKVPNPKYQHLRVLSLCQEPVNNIILALALSKLNGTLIPANAQSTPKQVAKFCRVVNADLLLFDLNELNFSGLESAPSLPSVNFQQALNTLDVIKEQPENNQAWSTLHDSFLLTLSSGSTGEPKPIVISQAVKFARAQQTIDLYQVDSADVVLNASPFFHSLGQRLSFVPLIAGATVVYLKKFTPNLWLQAVEQHQVSFTIPVATHLYALQPMMQQALQRMRSLRCIVTSSAPIDADFKKNMQQEIGCTFFEIYGATEIAIATNLAPEDFAIKHKTVGRPCLDVDLRIVNDNGEFLNTGELGEIACKTSLMFSGYYNLPELTSKSFIDNYFLTGDLGYIDVDGYLTYVSRKKDVIISGGINIYPAEVEQCILSNNLVSAVSVIGVEDALLGEVVLAICVGEQSVEMQLRQQANKDLVSYQRPIKYFFVDELPLTPSGKIDKMALRDFYNNIAEDWSAPLRALLYC